MVVVFCKDCGTKMELTDKEAKWCKVCKSCFAKAKQAEEGPQAVSKDNFKQQNSEATALRIARSVALDQAVATFAADPNPKKIFEPGKLIELAKIYAHYIYTGEGPVVEEKIEVK